MISVSLMRPDPWTKEFGISKNGNDLTKISKVTIFYVDEGYLPHPIFFMVRYVKNLKTKEELKEFEHIKEQVEKIEAKEQVEDMETNEQEEKIITENQKRKIEILEQITIHLLVAEVYRI